jgi:hypothetical protein
MNEQNQNRIPDFRDAVTFWKDQVQKLNIRNTELYAEIDRAEYTADKWFIVAVVFATAFITTLGIFLL